MALHLRAPGTQIRRPIHGPPFSHATMLIVNFPTRPRYVDVQGMQIFRFQNVSVLGPVVMLNHICLRYQNRLSKLENCVCSCTISAFPGPLARLCSSSCPSSSY